MVHAWADHFVTLLTLDQPLSPTTYSTQTNFSSLIPQNSNTIIDLQYYCKYRELARRKKFDEKRTKQINTILFLLRQTATKEIQLQNFSNSFLFDFNNGIMVLIENKKTVSFLFHNNVEKQKIEQLERLISKESQEVIIWKKAA
jgi:hypothetical protein